MDINKTDKRFPFSVTAVKKSATKAEIRIVGEIGWQTGSEDFRREADLLLADGVKDIHLYIMTPGGDCSEANEIVNILQKFTGTVTGEGGALVASAGTYIAMFCATFEMPENGIFMIHKPTGYTGGTVAEIEAYTKMLKQLEDSYFDTYTAKAADPADFEKRWNTGDYWMTASEAKDAGFITSVAPKVVIDRTGAGMIAACGYPKFKALFPELQTPTNENKTMSTSIALQLGLPAEASEDQIFTAISALKTKAETADTLQTEVTAMRDNQIVALVDNAIASRRIMADRKEHFVALGKSAGVDLLRTTLEAMTPDGKPMDLLHLQTPGGAGKKWEEMTAEERVNLRNTNPETFAKMVAEAYK